MLQEGPKMEKRRKKKAATSAQMMVQGDAYLKKELHYASNGVRIITSIPLEVNRLACNDASVSKLKRSSVPLSYIALHFLISAKGPVTRKRPWVLRPPEKKSK